MHVCEITLKKFRQNGSPTARGKKNEQAKPVLLRRKVEVKEIKGSVRLAVCAEGLEILKKSGGLAKFLKDREDKKLSSRLLRLKRKIHGEPKVESTEASA